MVFCLCVKTEQMTTQQLSTNTTLSHYRIISKLGAGAEWARSTWLAIRNWIDRRL